MQERIEKKLQDHFNPAFLKVVNDSHKHQGHMGDDGSGESHFFVKIVSSEFSGRSRIECQRMIFDLLEEEMKSLHALSISAKP